MLSIRVEGGLENAIRAVCPGAIGSLTQNMVGSDEAAETAAVRKRSSIEPRE
jgi:hypothetical protein